MTEQETQNTHDAQLKTILGFDPESGTRVEEEQVIQQVRDHNLLIPEEVKKEFIDWKRLLDRSKIIPDPVKHLLAINPEKLFSIEYYEYEDYEIFTRSHHAWQLASSGGITFTPTGRAMIDPWQTILRVETQGESESSSINLNGENFRVTLNKEGLFVSVEYVRAPSGLGPIKFCDLFIRGNADKRVRLYSPDYWPHDEFNVYKSKFYDGNGLLKTGGEIIKKGDASVKVGQNGVGYVLEIRSGPDQKVKLILPTHVNSSEVIIGLFDSLTISDPINAPLELDDSWRFSNLMEVVGIKHERF